MNIKKPHEKIRMIREAEGLGRHDFSRITNIPKRTLENIENKGTDPRAGILVRVCKAFPEYALWIMLDEININMGQISPQIKSIWEEYTFDKYEKSEFEAYGINCDIDEFRESGGEVHGNAIYTNLNFDRFNPAHRIMLNNLAEEYRGQINDAIDTTSRLNELLDEIKNIRDVKKILEISIDKNNSVE